MTIGALDWNKLEPFGASKRKSFEELVYQLVESEFSNDIEKPGVKIHPINDSGGGDGVEFYIEFPSGDIWGWQVKYFDVRSLGGPQIQQVKKSLAKAHKVHGDSLKRWYLCTTFNLTKPKWITDELPSLKIKGEKVLPDDHGVDLISWGESKLAKLLAKNIDIYNFFFTDFLFTPQWFLRHSKDVMNDQRVSRKYIKELHIDSDGDHKVTQVLGGKKFEGVFSHLVEDNQIDMYRSEYKESWDKLYEQDLEEYPDFLNEFRSIWQDKRSWLDDLFSGLEDLNRMVVSKKHHTPHYRKSYERLEAEILRTQKELLEIDERQDKLVGSQLRDVEYDDQYDLEHSSKDEQAKENSKRDNARDLLFGPYSALSSYALGAIQYVFRHFQSTITNELHIRGDAGYGKSHLCVSAFDEYSSNCQPAIFLHAEDIGGLDDIPKLLKCPIGWSIDDLFAALAIASKVYGSRALIIIDGLSETKSCEEVWRNTIPSVASKLRESYKNITLITSFRTSYQETLFYDDYFSKANYANICFLFGFNSLTNEAIHAYFSFYKIELKNTSDQLDVFDHPLYLRIYCQTKNPTRAKKVIVDRVNKNDIFGIFDSYIEQANARITTHLNKKTRYSHGYSRDKIANLAHEIWRSGTRSIKYSTFQSIISEDELEHFEAEDLLIYSDRENGLEMLSFAYDLMAGYVIAQSLLMTVADDESLHKLIRSEEFFDKLLSKSPHQLHDDILRCFIVLLFKDRHMLLSNILDDKKVLAYCVRAVFEIENKFIANNSEVYDLINSYVDGATNSQIWSLLNLSRTSMLDEDHPFNAEFWDERLRKLSMPDRDLLWSEYVRRADNGYSKGLVDSLYQYYRENDTTSPRSRLGAIYVSWVLTVTDRKLRDEATRALYWAGRKDPSLLYAITERSTDINDVYVFERLSSALYGLVMAAYGDRHAEWSRQFTETLLPNILRNLFDSVFGPNQTYNVEHYILRDNLIGVLKLGSLLNPGVLSQAEINSLDYPIGQYEHKTWGEYSKKHDNDPIGYPIHMDFENYTLGSLVNDRGNYDYDHRDYQRVVSNVYWRIFELGYRQDLFGDIDKEIANIPFRRSHSDDNGKIDRYGKKYSWIAYFELYTLLLDRGKLKDYNGEILLMRDSNVDIDPSFPETLRPIEYSDEVLVNDLVSNVDDDNAWVKISLDLFNTSLQSHRPLLDDVQTWVPLFSRIDQKNAVDNWTRDVFIHMSSALINEDDLKEMSSFLSVNEDISYRLFENISNTYLYAGEVPWSTQMNTTDFNDFFEIYKKNSESREGSLRVKLEPFVYETHWEDYHSLITPNKDMITPIKDLCDYFGLSVAPQSSNMIDAEGTVISKTFLAEGHPNSKNTHLYIRQDKLDEYLKARNLRMITILWSEKRLFSKGISNVMKMDADRDYREYCAISIYDSSPEK